MKTKVAASIIAITVLVVSLCVADSTNSPAGSDASAMFRNELRQTKALLDQLTARTTRLEQKVRALEQSNAELQQEVRMLQGPRWGLPPTNQAPHLTPLQPK